MAEQQQRPLSELATRYKHPTGTRHKIIAHTGKSGLTPIHAPLNYRLSLSQKQRGFIAALEAYQRRRCVHFTVQQLVDLEAFAPRYDSWEVENRPVGGIDLQVLEFLPIHPIFAKTKWNAISLNHIGKVPLGQGRPGYFEPQNPLVWKALDPCLRLASAFMTNCHTLTWWNALFYGSYEYITHGVPDELKGIYLRFKPSNGLQWDGGRLQQGIMDVSQHINFWVASGWSDPDSGLPLRMRGKFNYGLTSRSLIGGTNIHMAYELLEPLMRNDTTPAERKLDIFRFTVVLLHEICHAFWMEIQLRNRQNPDLEPYFDTQPVAELGHSMEQVVFGGRAYSVTDKFMPPLVGGQGVPSGAIFSIPLAHKGLTYTQKQVFVEDPPPIDWEYFDAFPIPVGYFEDIFHSGFWNHARQ